MSEFKTNKAVFVGVVLEKGGERKVKEYLDELQFLAETAGAIGDKMFNQRLDRPDKATYIGPGKLEEIKEYCIENEIEYVIFDDELTGMQQRNIEKAIACSDVIDRTSLILEIFAQRAKTSYAKMQVELAHYQYMLPRLAAYLLRSDTRIGIAMSAYPVRIPTLNLLTKYVTRLPTLTPAKMLCSPATQNR